MKSLFIEEKETEKQLKNRLLAVLHTVTITVVNIIRLTQMMHITIQYLNIFVLKKALLFTVSDNFPLHLFSVVKETIFVKTS